MTFEKLYNTGYVPFTFPEFVSGDPIEKTTVALVGGNTTYASGGINEDTQAYESDSQVAAMTSGELFSSKITSNYGITDAYIILYNRFGEEIYRHAVRVASAGRTSLSLAEEGDQVTVWQYAAVQPGVEYRMEIQVQLATGERPVIYNGTFTMDK
jgi:hypothetical protein